jgi:amino acid permease
MSFIMDIAVQQERTTSVREPFVDEAASSPESELGNDALIPHSSSVISGNDDYLVPLEGSAAPARSGTILSCTSVLANTILGIGTLSLPWAVSTCGWALGMTLFLVAAYFSFQSLFLLSKICCDPEVRKKVPEQLSFYTITAAASPRLAPFVDFIVALKTFGVATSYLQVVRDVMSPIIVSAFGDDDLDLKVCTMLLLFVGVFIAPVCYRKRVTKTAVANWVSLFAMVYIVLILVVAAVLVRCGWLQLDPDQEGAHNVLPPSGLTIPRIFKLFPVFIFSFTCHQNAFLVANELQNRTLPRMASVMGNSIGFAVLCYLLVIFSGYTTFGTATSNNFLDNLATGFTGEQKRAMRVFVLVGQVLLAVSVALSFPLQLMPCRRSLQVLYEAALGVELGREGEKAFRRVTTSWVLVGTIVLAMWLKSLGDTFEIVGAVGSNTICLIMPGINYCLLFWTRKDRWWFLALSQALLGLFVMCSSLGVRFAGVA